MLFTRSATGFMRFPGGFDFRFSRRPKPRYRVTELVAVPRGVFGPQYLLVTKRHYYKRSGDSQKRWYYEGPVFEIMDDGKKLVVRSYWYTMPEAYITAVDGDQTP
jgi:hypothetical protein